MFLLTAIVITSMLSIALANLWLLAGVPRNHRARERSRTMTALEQWAEIKSRLDARCPVVAWMEEDLGPRWAVELEDGRVHANPYEALAAYERAFARRGMAPTWLSEDRTHLVPRPATRTIAQLR